MDGLVVWMALGLVSVAVAGVSLSLAGEPPPDAASLAEAIEEVATSPHRVADAVEIRAAEFKVGGSRVSLRGPGGSAHASVLGASLTPARDGGLRRLLNGSEPAVVFDTPGTFERALRTARGRWDDWQAAPDRLRIRRVSWRGIDATLVG